MKRYGVALDLGTSGFRGQALDLQQDGAILATAVTSRHPLPGANVMDHIHFTLEVGSETAQEIMIGAVNLVLEQLGIDLTGVERLAICGNPIQLSLFQGIEIRDLAFAGQRKLDSLGVVPPKRDAHVANVDRFPGLKLPPHAEVLVPPAVRHEIGADALAMMLQTGMLHKEETALVTDYGTNAEMALIHKGVVYTGSTAAGPALEGQHIEDGILALPGAISDVEFLPSSARSAGPVRSDRPLPGEFATTVLDEEMRGRPGDQVDPVTGRVSVEGELEAVGITGTGVVALLSQGIRGQLVTLPRINTTDAEIHLPQDLKFTETDLKEAGKAIGSIRAGHLTLCLEAGIEMKEVVTAYMSGASGTYVDALKARELGMVPPLVERIYQVGNTSLAMARDMAADPDKLWMLQDVADHLRQHHCMFAASKVFEKVYILELAYWTEGMPDAQYDKFLKKYGFPPKPTLGEPPEVIKTVERDIPDFGPGGLRIIRDIGIRKDWHFEGCTGCGSCVEECPEKAILLAEDGETWRVSLDTSLCNGIACRRCERICPEKGFDLVALFTGGAAKREF
ncbi:MAG: methylamine methyltransferase corrinoid protein reductive activase [Deltaproteobacteria bacterium]|nr:methylamine methyltransferase corrinoid protein reductive activase [Deltaproteobacteria bacterium]